MNKNQFYKFLMSKKFSLIRVRHGDSGNKNLPVVMRPEIPAGILMFVRYTIPSETKSHERIYLNAWGAGGIMGNKNIVAIQVMFDGKTVWTEIVPSMIEFL